MRNSLIVALCACMALVSGCGGRRSEQARQEGDTYLTLGKTPEAARAFSRALELNPNNARAKLGQGRALALDGKNDDALSAYREAIRLDPALGDAYVSVVGLLLETSKTEEAEALARQFEQVDAENGSRLMAHVFRVTNRDEKAVELLTDLKGKFPKSAPVRVDLAEALVATRKFEQAGHEFDTVLEGLDRRSEAARMGRIDVYLGQGKLQDMLPTLKKDAESNPGDAGCQLALARALMELGAATEAENIAGAIVMQEPDSGWANYVFGGCMLRLGKPADARMYLEKAAILLPGQPVITRALELARAGGTPLGQQKPAQPGVSAATETPALPPSQADESWQALWRQARLGRLIELRDTFLAQGGDNLRETLTLAALFTMKSALADSLAESLPGDSPLKAYLKAFQDKKPEGMVQAAEAWTESGDSDRMILRENALGFAFALQGRRSQALLTLSETAKRFPDNGMAIYNLSTMYGAARMPEFQARTLYKLVGQFPSNTEARDMLFNVFCTAGDSDRALEVAQSTYALFPANEQAILNLARAYTDGCRFDTALAVLRKGIETLPGNRVLPITLADTLLMSGKPDEAGEALVKTTPSAELKPFYDEVRAFTDAAKGDWPRVLDVCEKADAAVSPAMRYLYCAALIQANRAGEAMKPLTDASGGIFSPPGPGRALAAALGKASEDGAWAELGKALAASPAGTGKFAYGLACFERQIFDAALAVFTDLDKDLPGQPGLVTLALNCLARGKAKPDRIDAAKAFISRYASMSAAWTGLADVYASVPDRAQENEALKKAVAVGPNDPEAWQRASRLAEEEKDQGRALEAYQKLAALKPDDPIVNNNFAYSLLAAGGDVKEAVKRASQALETLRANPRAMPHVVPKVMHTLGLAQLRAGDLESARLNLAKALDLQPGDPTMLLDFGQMLIASGEAEKGKAHAELAVRYADLLGLDFPRRAEAEKLLGKP